MSLEDRFKAAAEDVNNLKARPTDAELTEVYGLYKQATVGEINTDRPGMLDFKGKTKWDAWSAKKGMTKEAAMEQYIMKSKQLVETYGKK